MTFIVENLYIGMILINFSMRKKNNTEFTKNITSCTTLYFRLNFMIFYITCDVLSGFYKILKNFIF